MDTSVIILLATLTLTSCNTGRTLHGKTEESEAKKRVIPETIYSIDSDNDGIYEFIEIAEEDGPLPIQGKQQFTADFYRALKYPASARENDIQGIVILEIEIDSNGKVQMVNTKKGISADCDRAAETAYINASKEGFWPLIFNNNPVNFKMEKAIGFWLEH